MMTTSKGTTNGLTVDAGKFRARVIRVTPEMASEWLATGRNFRPLTKTWAMQIARNIQVDGWKCNGDPFRFNHAGEMTDGQHRAFAIQHLGITVEAVVAHCTDDRGVDENRRRTIVQHLHQRGERYRDVVATALRHIGAHEKKLLHLSGQHLGELFTNGDLIALLERHPLVRDSAARAYPLKAKIGANAGQLAFLHYVAGRAGLCDEAERFVDHLEHGVGLLEDDPVFRLRERYLLNRGARAKLPEIDRLALLIRSWSYWLTGRRMKIVRWRATGPKAEAFPELVLTKPDDGLELGQ